ncbi:MAG: 1-deoxy-D-xylulose-5-phosphate synthase, partial [Bacillota bacterium]|nr:1-deoxy-D-xylulose-5-phosphate synthase [Bacillota bacterium]
GLSGFPKPSESPHDAFVAGHASTSVSAALGMARARTLQNRNYSVVTVTGDGALTGGMIYEALNDAGQSREPLIIILNDNEMSITKNVGAIAKTLAKLRIKPRYFKVKRVLTAVLLRLPFGNSILSLLRLLKKRIKNAFLAGSFFENMGFIYLGPVDGHDISALTHLLRYARDLKKPVIIHALTQKGKGYRFSEENPEIYHGVSKFDVATGVDTSNGRSFSSVFGHTLCALAEDDEKICAITAAMGDGTGLLPFSKRFPKRYFDVGIAEEHAVTMASAMAKQGMHPVCAIYSTFLQRSFDQVIHDTAIDNIHTVFAVDRAGFVGEDGETHNGVFDVGMFSMIPGVTIYSPSSYNELSSMLKKALYETEGLVAVRYPRGKEGAFKGDFSHESASVLVSGRDITIVSYGILINEAVSAAEELSQKHGISAEVIKLNRIFPFEFGIVFESLKKTRKLVVSEDCVASGSIGEKLSEAVLSSGPVLKTLVLLNSGDRFTKQSTVREAWESCSIDSGGIVKACLEALSGEREEKA